MNNAIPTWVFTFIALALIAGVVIVSIKTSGGIRKPARLLTLVIVTVVYLFSLTFVKDVKPLLGLDLQGGVSITLLAKGNPSSANIEVAKSIIDERVNGLGVAEPDIYREGNNIVVDLPGAEDSKRAEELIGQTAKLYFREVAENNFDFSSSAGGDPQVQQVLTQIYSNDQTKNATTKKLDEKTKKSDTTSKKTTATSTSTTSSTSTTKPKGGAGKNVANASAAVTTTTQVATTSTSIPIASIPATPSSLEVKCGGTAPTTYTLTGDLSNYTSRENDKPDLPIIAKDKTSGIPILLCPSVLGGDIVKDAYKQVDSQGEITTAVELKGKSSGDFTSKIGSPLSGKAVAIVLDSVVISAPVIQPELAKGLTNNTISISFGGSKNVNKEADNLAQVLKFGALPVVLEQQTAQKISPTLGTDQLHSGLIAGGIGLLLVILFMFAYYRILSLVVFGGIALSAMTTYALISWLGDSQGLSLTLAGIVGLIVSLGVTVDSYVVYFEKLKDEVKHGRSVRSSLDAGFKASFRTILAADLISLFGAITLFYLAAGSVRGFAFFLGISTLLDLGFSVCFMHPLVKILAKSPKLITNKFYGFAAALDNKDITA